MQALGVHASLHSGLGPNVLPRLPQLSKYHPLHSEGREDLPLLIPTLLTRAAHAAVDSCPSPSLPGKIPLRDLKVPMHSLFLPPCHGSVGQALHFRAEARLGLSTIQAEYVLS